MTRHRRRGRPLTVDAVCAALNHLSGSAARVRLAGVAEVARDLEETGRLALAALRGPEPEMSLAVLVMSIERAKRKTEEIIRHLADLPPAEAKP